MRRTAILLTCCLFLTGCSSISKEDYVSLQESYQLLDNNYIDLQTDYESLDQNYKNLQADYQSLDQTYKDLQANYTSLQSQYNDVKTELDSLSNAKISQAALEEQLAAKEADVKQLSEDKVVLESEVQRLTEEVEQLTLELKQAAQSNATTADSTIVASADQNEVTSSPASTENSTMVWIDDTAKRYHRKDGCGMDNAYQVTLEEAIEKGKTPCGRCY